MNSQLNKGKGLAVPGPKGLQSMPEELTISLWVYPTKTSFGYLMHAFERVEIYADHSLSVFFKYLTGPNPANVAEPVYTVNNKIVTNKWNYVSVSLREYLDFAT